LGIQVVVPKATGYLVVAAVERIFGKNSGGIAIDVVPAVIAADEVALSPRLGVPLYLVVTTLGEYHVDAGGTDNHVRAGGANDSGGPPEALGRSTLSLSRCG
jgi:hypothetical protein